MAKIVITIDAEVDAEMLEKTNHKKLARYIAGVLYTGVDSPDQTDPLFYGVTAKVVSVRKKFN